MTLQTMLIVAAILFSIGLYGALARRNVIAVFMGIELMFNAVNLTLVALGPARAPQAIAEDIGAAVTGQVFAVFVIAVAAAEVALGLGIVFALYRNTESVDLTDAAQMRG